jgi:tetratricopeptide (TPR) repeat protein
MAAGLVASLGNFLSSLTQKTKNQTGCLDLKPRPTKITLTAVLICFATVTAWSQSSIELYNQAGLSYQSKEYRKAADDYEKLLAQGHETSEVYYNLGNCYFKMDSIARCILSFERALKLSPGDDDIVHNLELARLKTVDKIKPVPQLQIVTWWYNFINSEAPADGR